MKLIPIFAGFFGIILLLGTIPPSTSGSEVPPFTNPNAVSHMSETATEVLDDLPEPKSKAKIAHEKITQFMKQKNKVLSPTANPPNSNENIPKFSYDNELPVFISFVNETSNELIIGLDNNSANRTYAEYEAKAKEIVGNEVPIKLISGFTKELACTSQTSICRPIWGGVEMSGGTGNPATLTLPFANDQGDIGFIVSGHAVGGASSGNVYQPSLILSQGEYVGDIISNPLNDRSSDAAFVKRLPGIELSQEIFKTSGQSYEVTGTLDDSTLPFPSLVYMMGITSGELFGDLENTGVTLASATYTTLDNQSIFDIIAAAGDSGAPVFDKEVGGDVNFLGIVVGIGCFIDEVPPSTLLQNTITDCLDNGGIIKTVYSPWESIRDDLDLVDFGGICSPPISGDWIITQKCVMIKDASVDGDVIVNSPAVLTIPDGITLDIDFTNQKNLEVKIGAGVKIIQGGTIT